MSFDQHTNFAYTTVDTAPTPAASGVSLTVAVGAGALFPAAPFNAVIYPNGQVPLSTNAEIVRVTLVVGDTFTITRTQEGTSARTILSGDQIAAAITVKTLTDVESAIPSIAGLLSAVNISAGLTSQDLSAFKFDNSNGVNFGLTGSVITATVATNYQSQGAYLTTAGLSQDSSKYAGVNGAITGGSITVNTSGVSVALPNYLTTAALSQDSSRYAGTAGAITGGSITVNTSGVSVNLPAYITTAMASARGSDFVNATAAFAGTNASGTIASNGISVSVAAAGAANINFSAGTTSNNLTQLSFKDTNGVSFGLNGGTLSATVKTDYQSSGAYLTTAMVSNRGSDFVQATAAFHGTNISGTINSNDISLSVAAPAAASINFSAGTTSGNLTQVSFKDSNGVSFGLDAGSITATVRTDYQSSGNYLTTAMQSNAATISNINVSGGTTSSNLSALKFVDSQGVSWSLDTGSKIYATVKTDYQTSGAYLTTAALSQDSSKYAGINGAITGGSITVNTSGVSVNLPAYITTAALSGDTTKYVQAWAISGNTSGTTSSAQGTKIYFQGGNSLTVSGSSNTIVFSVGNYLTTAALSQDSSKYAGINGAITGGSITVNTSGVSVNLPAYLTTAALSGDTSKYVQAWELTGNTSGTTSSAQGTKLYLSGGNSITVSGNSNTIVFSVGNYLTTAALSADSSKYAGTGFTTATTAGTAIVGTHNTAGLSMGVPAYLTTAALSADSSKYAGTGFTSAGANISFSGTLNTAGLSLSASVAAPGAAAEANWVTLTGNIVGNSSASGSTIAWSGGNGVTLSGTNNSVIGISVSTYSTVGTATTVYDVASASSNGTVTRWAAEDHRHAGIGAIGISTSGNTTGTTGSNYGTIWFQGGSNITVSQITSNNGSHTIAFAGKNEGYQPILEPYPLLTATQTFAPGAGTWYLAPFTAFNSMSGGRINVLVNNTGTANLFLDIGETAYNSNTTGSIQQSYTFQANVALFSQGTGANSSLLQSLWSNSHTFGWSKVMAVSISQASNINISMAQSVSYISDIGSDGAYTNVQYAGAGSSTVGGSSTNSTRMSTVFSSGRNLLSGSLVQPFGFNTTISAGVYWLGYAWSSTRARASTGNLTTGSDFSFGALLGMSRLAVDSVYRNFGSTASTDRSQLVPYGLYTAAANMTPPVDIKLSSDLSSLASQWVPYFNFQVRGLTK